MERGADGTSDFRALFGSSLVAIRLSAGLAGAAAVASRTSAANRGRLESETKAFGAERGIPSRLAVSEELAKDIDATAS